MVKADEAVCRGIGVLAPELFGPQRPAGDVADFEQVERRPVFLLTIYSRKEMQIEFELKSCIGKTIKSNNKLFK